MKRLAVALLLIPFSQPVLAQEDTYEPADAEALQMCLEAVDAEMLSADFDGSSSRYQCIGAASDPCQEEPGGSSTQGGTACMRRETAWWDEQLNAAYTDIKDNVTDEAFSLLQDAQRAWITYRDKACEFIYEVYKDGTISQTYYASCMLDITARRSIALMDALEG